MTPNEYQQLANRTSGSYDTLEAMIANGVFGLCGESGEVADLVKKWTFQGHILDRDKMVEELGDVLWYVALLATALHEPLEAIMQANIDKLRKRYPDGFDPERSVNRDE